LRFFARFVAPGLDEFFFADVELGAVVVQHQRSRERAFALGNQHQRECTAFGGQIERNLFGHVSATVDFFDDFRLECCFVGFWQHQLTRFGQPGFFPCRRIFDLIVPAQGERHLGAQRLVEHRQRIGRRIERLSLVIGRRSRASKNAGSKGKRQQLDAHG